MQAKYWEKLLYLSFTNDRDLRYKDWLNRLENLDYSKRTRLLFSELRSKNCVLETFNAIRNSEGSLSESRSECLSYWASYCEKLYRGHGLQHTRLSPVENKELDYPISFIEFKLAIKSLKNNKAPGNDFITNEDIKQFLCKETDDLDSFEFSDVALHTIFNLMVGFWDCEKIPSNLKKVILRPFLKDSDKDEYNPENYRTISLLNTLFKVYEAIIHKRLVCYLEDKLLL